MRAYSIIGALALAAVGIMAACNDPGAQQPYREENTGETLTGEDVNVLESIPEGLALVNYELEPQTGQISGSIMNNDTISFVNVQITFDVYDAGNNVVATVWDTTSEVQPGDTWQFGAVIPADKGAVRAVPTEVQGIPRPMLDGQSEAGYPQNNPAGETDNGGPVQPPRQ